MSGRNRELEPPRVLVPQAPVLVAGFREVLWLSPDGEIEALAPAEARSRVERETPMLCHARATARRLDMPVFPALDLLELFAFVRPATFCVPTPRGLAEALRMSPPRRPAEMRDARDRGARLARGAWRGDR
jgi:ATP-dependent DNA helicase DinG